MAKFIDWNKNPEIKWEKVKCPICSQPTGRESKCYEMMPTDDDDDNYGDNRIKTAVMSKTVDQNNEILPIFHEQCAFRKYNNFFLHVNFPISVPLAGIIAQIDGVERFIIETKYRGTVTIGDQFDETAVKSKITEAFIEFIKEQVTIQSKEECKTT